MSMMVVDCGGGTVDVVVHQKVPNVDKLCFREIAIGDGALCGSTFVDESFKKLFEDKVPGFSAAPARSVNKIMEEWVGIKHSFTGNEPKGHTFPIDQLSKSLKQSYDLKYKGMHPNHPDDADIPQCSLSKEELADLFQYSVTSVKTLINKQLENTADCQMICLVGGFGQSEYLRRQIGLHCRERGLTLVEVKHPSAAVFTGASILAMDPTLIRYRRMRYSYGIAASRLALPGECVDGVSTWIDTSSGVCHVLDNFDMLVRKGTEISPDYIITRDYLLPRYDKDIIIPIYISSSDNPRSIRDPSCSLVRRFKIRDVNDEDFPCTSGIRVRLYFGRNLMTLEVQDMLTNAIRQFNISRQLGHE